MSQIIDRGPYSEILKICTKLDPKKRFQSAASLRDTLATIDSDILKSETEAGIEIAKYLERKPVNLSEDEVEEIIDYIDDESVSDSEKKSIILQIDLEHIEIIKQLSILKRFSTLYCDYIKTASFQFGTCDALASRINKLIKGEDPSIQTDGIMALLYMGTNHNRWYVENMFVGKVNKDADANLIKRLNMEFEVEGEELCSALSHLTRSVGFTYSSLHPLLLTTVKKYCKLS